MCRALCLRRRGVGHAAAELKGLGRIVDDAHLKHTLVCGFGNLYRRDDGVARVVVDAVRERVGHEPLDPLDDGFGTMGHWVDTVVAHQLVPELAEVLADYDLVIFVDAHVVDLGDALHEERIEKAWRSASILSHQCHVGMLLELACRMYGTAPEGVLLSLRGYDFDFGLGLSAETTALVPRAVERILTLIDTRSGSSI
jgi:hydrogenase maturation protease